MTHYIEGSGAAIDLDRYGMGELGLRNRAAERVLEAPARPRALIRLSGRSPGPMVPWPRSLSRAKYPVSLLTARTGGA